MLTVLLWHVLNIDVKVLKNRDVDGALAARPEHRRGGHHRHEVDCAPVARPVRVIISVMLTVLLRHVMYPPAARPEGHHKRDVDGRSCAAASAGTATAVTPKLPLQRHTRWLHLSVRSPEAEHCSRLCTVCA